MKNKITLLSILVIFFSTIIFATSIKQLEAKQTSLYKKYYKLLTLYTTTKSPTKAAQIREKLEALKIELDAIGIQIQVLKEKKEINSLSSQNDLAVYANKKLEKLENIVPDSAKKIGKLSFWEKLIVKFGIIPNSKLEKYAYYYLKQGNINKALTLINKAYNNTRFEKRTEKLLYLKAKIYKEALKQKLVTKEEYYNAVKELERHEENIRAFNLVMKFVQPYVEAQVAFKIGGFDTAEQFKEKVKKGYKVGLHSDEMFEKYINPKTWRFYSKKAQKEFYNVAGVDCAGFVQRVMLQIADANKIKTSIPRYKIPGSRLLKYTRPIPEDGHIPPKSLRPGDLIFLKHDTADADGIRWGHFFMFMGYTEKGDVLIAEASSSLERVVVRPLPPRYLNFYKGAARFKVMDEAFKKKINL